MFKDVYIASIIQEKKMEKPSSAVLNSRIKNLPDTTSKFETCNDHGNSSYDSDSRRCD